MKSMIETLEDRRMFAVTAGDNQVVDGMAFSGSATNNNTTQVTQPLSHGQDNVYGATKMRNAQS